MMYISFLLDIFRCNAKKDAIIWRDRAFSYGWLTDAIDRWTDRLDKERVETGAIVSVEADFSPIAVVGFFWRDVLQATLQSFLP